MAPSRSVLRKKKGEAITVNRKNKDAAIDNTISFMYFQPGTGALVKTRLYENESRGFKARRLVYPIHTGSLLGWPTKIIALIAALTATTLPVTGFFVWLNRKKKKKTAQAKKPAQKEVLLAKDSVSFPAGIS